MTEHDDISSVDDAVLAFAAQNEPKENDGGAGAPATPPQEQSGRVQKLIRDKRTADAFAASSAAQAAALRERFQNAGRPQDYRAPEDYTRAVAEQAVREVGAEILNRQANQAQEIAARAAQGAWEEFDRRIPGKSAGLRCRRPQPEPYGDSGHGRRHQGIEPWRGDRLLPREESR